MAADRWANIRHLYREAAIVVKSQFAVCPEWLLQYWTDVGRLLRRVDEFEGRLDEVGPGEGI